ncbi:unnamed protein product [Ectocarpus sp. CCAP 1310/34]|nr:unnamed protein product [Ectocarpus sp. CCAP 1310/34]
MDAATKGLAMGLKGVSLEYGAPQVRRDDESTHLEGTAAAAVGCERREPFAMGLVDMAGEFLRSVICLLEQRDMVILGGTCRSLRQIQGGFVSGEEAFPLLPTVDERHGNEDNAVEVDTETGALRKTPRPGMGTIMAKERVDKMTCYWEVKIQVFTGVRLEVGVATRRSIYRGGCDKDECWVIDCYGRACHGTRLRGYGCKLKAGDVLGVLLNTADDSLSFFVKGMHLTMVCSDDDLYTLVLLTSSTTSCMLGREGLSRTPHAPLPRCRSAFVSRPRSVACSVSRGFDGVFDGFPSRPCLNIHGFTFLNSTTCFLFCVFFRRGVRDVR